MSESLLNRTYALLDSSDLTIREISDGAGVNYHWLGKLKQRAFRDPGINRIERVYRYLADHASKPEAAA